MPISPRRSPPSPPPPGPTPVYSPWTEDPGTLRQRTVGRAEVLEQIRSGARRHAAGERPLPIYLFGPRGVGKSHVVTLMAEEARGSLEGVEVRVIGEDIPQPRDAEALWARLVEREEKPAWMAWMAPVQVARPRRAVVFVEGWDRLLDSLGPDGRKALRRTWLEHPEVWVVATGARLDEPLTGKDEAFFAAFDAIPLNALAEAEAAALVDERAGEEARAHPRWSARREALLVLGGGNPRALVALAEAVAAAPGEEVARRLLEVLDRFSPHYQIRWRDCSRQEQALVDLLARAPRELGPTEAASILGESSQTWSSVARRLEEHGVLTSQREGRNAWYRLTEPLFRHWLEYRNAPTGRSRIGWLGRLLERVLGPDELIAAWTQGEDEVVRSAALDALARRADARDGAWVEAVRQVEEALQGGQSALGAVEAAVKLRPDAARAWTLLLLLAASEQAALGARLAPPLRQAGCPVLASMATGLDRAVEARDILRGLARDGQDELRRAAAWEAGRARATAELLPFLLDRAIAWKDPRGGVWKVKPAEALALAAIPGLRYRLLRHGRLPGHGSLVEAAHIHRVALAPADPDLPLLLWWGLAHRDPALAGRVLALLNQAPLPRMPWCPWPGRALQVDVDQLCRVLARARGSKRLSWLGAVASAPADTFRALLDSLVPGAGPGSNASGFELALARLKREAPDRFEAVVQRLGEPWQPTAGMAAILLDQLAEARRGPLHPELERIRRVLEDPTPW